jgi:cell division septum initiation protein DivIVA
VSSDRPGQSPYESPQVESVLREIRDLVEQARPMPLSTSVMINQSEVLDLLDEVAERLPEELRASKWLLKQREEFLARTRREADELLEEAREKADQMVQKTEVVKAAEARARSVVDAADAEARRLKLEAEDFCDQRLASFEIVLERTMKVVNAGRLKLQGSQARDEDDDGVGAGPPPERPRLEAVPDHRHQAFFDQDDDV